MTPNVLFLLHLPPPVHGSSLIGMSIKESLIINRTSKNTYINLLSSQNISESGKVSCRKILGFVNTLIKVFFSIICNRPRLCYLAFTTTGAAFYKDVLLVALLRLFRIKRVYHLHNKGISKFQNHWIHNLFYHFVFKDVDVILLSKYLYSDIEKFVPENRIHICPNGIPHFQSKIQNLIPDTEKVNILFLSNLIESKGVFVLLDACVLLKKKKISFECTFIGGEGDINASRFNEKAYQLGLSDRVTYLGEKFDEKKNLAFSQATIFAFPTYKDCFPLVLLEAMSYSLPVVSTFEGGIPDIVEDGITGFLVQQKNVEQLTEKLELLIKNPELRRHMGLAGRKKQEQEFTLEKFECMLDGILQKLIEK